MLAGDRHLHAALLDAVLVGADAAHVRRVRDHAPRHLPEPIPLAAEVVAAVIADLEQQAAVRDRYLGDVRRVDDQLAAVGHDRLELVHALAADPQLLVHLRHARQHGVKRALLVDDVRAPREFAGLGPRRLRRAADDGRRVNRRAGPPCRNTSWAPSPARPRRSTTLRTGVHLLPMIIGLVTTAPSQWKKLRMLGAADAGEQVLVAAGEADDLVREHRADDDDAGRTRRRGG